jgi:hypothetical protein
MIGFTEVPATMPEIAPATNLPQYVPQVPPVGQARVLESSDFSIIMELRSIVFQALPDRRFLYPEDDDPQFIRMHLGQDGMSVGVFADNHLIAFTNLTLPTGDKIGMPWLGIPTRQVKRHHALLMNGIVHPGLEGKGLHKYLINERLRIAAADHRPMARVLASPYNYRSWGNFIWHGFIVKGFIRPFEPKFGTILRYVLDRDTRQQLVGRPETSVFVDATDIQQQETFFERGMLGFNRVMKDNKSYLELMVPQEVPLEY